ncbi:hypothetical protein [Fictibacillus barbaricus]|uniref:Uncharacterized protein n=1 Tax=Fictibacillus barbaricus TaxID=182136 RepID=A0ABU1TWZ0_9BACL|nr:hypothetical protein [Fictibacillus barbaricus]MDR7071690.1 hypothetical protein [Fictibacillus barbaricus]
MSAEVRHNIHKVKIQVIKLGSALGYFSALVSVSASAAAVVAVVDAEVAVDVLVVPAVVDAEVAVADVAAAEDIADVGQTVVTEAAVVNLSQECIII